LQSRSVEPSAPNEDADPRLGRKREEAGGTAFIALTPIRPFEAAGGARASLVAVAL
jgi:hypothetical protein